MIWGFREKIICSSQKKDRDEEINMQSSGIISPNLRVLKFYYELVDEYFSNILKDAILSCEERKLTLCTSWYMVYYEPVHNRLLHVPS